MKKASQKYMEQKVESKIFIEAKSDNPDVYNDKSLRFKIISNDNFPIEKALETFDVITLLYMFLRMKINTILEYI